MRDILILGSPLPELSPMRARRLCLLWESALARHLSLETLEHIRRFAMSGPALRARLSRLAARLLLVRGLGLLGAQIPLLHREASGRPALAGHGISFSHSGPAAFCAIAPGRPALGLDAEALSARPPQAGLRGWVVKEALVKAQGTGFTTDPAAIPAGRPGSLAGGAEIMGASYAWRLLPFPGHWLAVAVRGQSAGRPSCYWFGARENASLPR